MKKLGLVVGVIALVCLLATAGAVPAVAATQRQQCTGQFEGTVTSGADTGLSLTGSITLLVHPSGEIDGVFVKSDSSRVDIEGRFNAPIIKLKFDLPNDQSIVGVGELPGGFTPCTSNFGGSFKGPRRKDRGDWGIIWGS